VTSEKYDNVRLSRVISEIMGDIGFTLGAQRQTNRNDSFFEMFGEVQTSGLGRFIPSSIISRAGGIIGLLGVYGPETYEKIKNTIGLEDDFITKSLIDMFNDIFQKSGSLFGDHFPRVSEVLGGKIGDDIETIEEGNLGRFIPALSQDVEQITSMLSRISDGTVSEIVNELNEMAKSESDAERIIGEILSKLDVDQIDSLRHIIVTNVIPAISTLLIASWESSFLDMTEDFPGGAAAIKGIFNDARVTLGLEGSI